MSFGISDLLVAVTVDMSLETLIEVTLETHE
jgi:hypothetical protein